MFPGLKTIKIAYSAPQNCSWISVGGEGSWEEKKPSPPSRSFPLLPSSLSGWKGRGKGGVGP